MSAIFTLPYAEYEVVNQLMRHFPKKDGFAVLVPASRTQKGFDLVLMNESTKKCISLQVKSSRSWADKTGEDFQFHSWSKRFDVSDNHSDYYVIFLTYPLFNKNGSVKRSPKGWGNKILMFTRTEMAHILSLAKNKDGSPSRFFSFGFTIGDKHGGRISAHTRTSGGEAAMVGDYEKNLLEHSVKKILAGLNQEL